MTYTSEEIAKLTLAFRTFWTVERQGQGDDKAWTYLFDVLLRPVAEQQTEIARWISAQEREITRRLPDVATRVQQERDTAEQQLIDATALRTKVLAGA